MALLEDQVRTRRVGWMLSRRFGRLVWSPDPLATATASVGELRVAVEVGLRALERAVAQCEEALEVPAADVGLVGVEIEREVDEVGDVDPPDAALEHIDALEHHDVGRADRAATRRR